MASAARLGWVAVLVSVLALSGCQSRPVEVTAEDDGAAVRLEVGQELQVMLDSNPSTGYSWVVENDSSDVLRSAGDPTWESSDPSLTGAPGTTTMFFEGANAGQTELVLTYRRPWEMTVTPDATFTLDVTVE